MYEIKISYVTVDKNGNDKMVRESLILEHAESFADAEQIGYDYGSGLTAIDVTDVKRSKLKEVLNERSSNEEQIWMAELMDIFVDDEGNEKPIKYKTIIFATTFDKAKAFVSEYIKQEYNLELISLKLTKFNDVLK